MPHAKGIARGDGGKLLEHPRRHTLVFAEVPSAEPCYVVISERFVHVTRHPPLPPISMRSAESVDIAK